MPARDLYHDVVKNALIKDGWTITHDPLTIEADEKFMYIDLGAETLIAAEKATRKIAVEIKSFLGKSDVDDLEKALGRYVLYQSHLEESEPDRKLFVAVPSEVFSKLFERRIGEVPLRKKQISLIVFEEEKEEILQWIN